MKDLPLTLKIILLSGVIILILCFFKIIYDFKTSSVSTAKITDNSGIIVDNNVLAALSKSQQINKQAEELTKEIKIQEDRMIAFGGNITKASYMYKEDNLTCKQRVTYKVDIIKALYSIAYYVQDPIRHELLDFESKYLVIKDNCSKNLKYKEPLDKLTERTMDVLNEQIQKHKEMLTALKSSVFYTNHN